jgi:cytochrome c biogenesis protein CcdA
MEQINARPLIFDENHRSRADGHACKTYRQIYEQARDQLRRAERDLAETAAFIAGSLTTVTAVQAVITLARHDLELPKNVLQWAFQGYIAIFLLILVLGAVRVRSAIRRRAQAEREIDQSKKGMFIFCPIEQLPPSDEKE